jgi:excisionase family DNA binding protein
VSILEAVDASTGGLAREGDLQNRDEQLLLRIPEAAARLGLGRSTIYELIAAGELPAIKIGRAVRVPASRLTAWVEQQAQQAEAEQTVQVV